MQTLDFIRKALRKQCAKTAGDDGEEYAKKWLENSGWDFEKIEQGKYDLSKKLKEYGGKRPDFIVDPNDNKSILLVDAKYHSTNNCSVFKLQDAEIAQYRALVKYCKDNFPNTMFDMLFLVIPKEKDGKELVWVHLDEFKNGKATKLAGNLATMVSLNDRSELWCKNA